MISIIDSGKLVNTEVSPMVPRSCEMVGLSTDSKPTGVSVGNGWSFIEMDTGKVFFYNAADEEWLEFAGSGGGGGQGGSNVLVVGLDTATMTLDKTWQEIHDADFAVIKTVFGDQITIGLLKSLNVVSNEYYVSFTFIDYDAYNIMDLVADSANGYPVMQGD